MDLAVAAENATLLKDLVQSVETPTDDPVVQDLAQRCRQMQAGIQQVIQKVQDDSVMASALQARDTRVHPVCFKLLLSLSFGPVRH